MTQVFSVLLKHAAPISGSVVVLMALISLGAQIARLIYKYRLTAIKKASSSQLTKLVGDESVRLGISAENATPEQQATFINNILHQREKNSQRVFMFFLVSFMMSVAAFLIVVLARFPYMKIDPSEDEPIRDMNINKVTFENKIIWFKSFNLGLNKITKVSYFVKNGKKHRIVSPTIIRYFYAQIPTRAVTEEVAELFPEGDKITYKNGMYIKHYACNGACQRYMIIENQLRPVSDEVAATYSCSSGKAVEMVQEDIDGSADSLEHPAPSLKEKGSESGAAKTLHCLLPQSEG